MSTDLPSKDAQDFHEINHNTPLDVLAVLNQLGELVDAALTEYGTQADEYWRTLSPDQQLMAFYAVCKRIHKGDVLDKGSYRHVLYDVFGFDTDSYGVGMACGYLAIHNHIAESVSDSQPEPTVNQHMSETKTSSRYGTPRVVFRDDADFIMEGASHYYRVGMNDENTEIAYFDPEGGPFIAVGATEPEFENRTVTSLRVEAAPSGRFRVRVQVAP